MSEVHSYIEKCVRKDIGPSRIVDVYGVARKVLRKFPGQTLRQLVEAVGAAVAAHRGNAMWDNDHHAAAARAKDRLQIDAGWSGRSLVQKMPLPDSWRQETALYARDIIDTGI
jgi:hypothetical protein